MCVRSVRADRPGRVVNNSIKMNLVVFLSLICLCRGVPPTPVDRLWEELDKTKGVMTNIAGQLEKFNSLYLMKLEQKVVTIAATLANIDSNVKNIQERAHVWDTFQLHVAAWNEQISTLDKKIEIISRGQEKILNLDSKLNSVSNMEYKTERVIGKQDDTISLIQSLIKTVENQPHDPLLSEFTTRGVLSTLKLIERKLDKIQMQFSSSQSILSKQILEHRKEPEKNRLLIKCNTPPKVEELLSDVASKVDVMFDKFSNDESSGDYHSDEQRDSTEISEFKDPDLKLIKNLLRRLNQPCKRTVKVLETLESSIRTIDNTTLSIYEDGQSIQNDLISYGENQEKLLKDLLGRTDEIGSKVDGLKHEVGQKFGYEHDIVSSHFREQREHIAGMLKNFVETGFVRKEDYWPTQVTEVRSGISTSDASSHNTTSHASNTSIAGHSTSEISNSGASNSDPQTTTSTSSASTSDASTPGESTSGASTPGESTPAASIPGESTPVASTPDASTYTTAIHSNKSYCNELSSNDPSGIYIFSIDSDESDAPQNLLDTTKNSKEVRQNTVFQNSSNGNQTSLNGNQNSPNGNQNPLNGNQNPLNGNQTPPNGIKIAANGVQNPPQGILADEIKNPSGINQNLTGVFQNPLDISQNGSSVFQNLSSVFQNPSGAYQNPPGAYQNPPSSYQNPSGAYQNPSVVFQKPLDTYRNRKYNPEYCEVTNNGIWTVIQRRGINPKEQNFSLSWSEYKNGFGRLDQDFWLGNDHIHRLTNQRKYVLRVELEDFDGNTAWAEYSEFKVMSEKEKYRLILGRYRGNASDSFSSHNNSRFSTYDQNNDDAPACCPCSPAYGGGWWFYSCFEANLNGVYQNQPGGSGYFKGLIWEHWLGNYSLRKTKMMIQPVTDRFEQIGVEVDSRFKTDNKNKEEDLEEEEEEEEEIPEDP